MQVLRKLCNGKIKKLQWQKQIGTNKILFFGNNFTNKCPHAKQIYFAGGESFIIEEHYEILEHAIKMGYAKIQNCVTILNGVEWREDLFELLSLFC